MARGVLTSAPAPMVGPVTGTDVHVGLHYYPESSGVSRWNEATWGGTGDGVWAGDPPVEDVSCNVVSVRTSIGRDLPLERFRTGSATVVLYDPDGKWSPWASEGGYNSVRPGIDLSIWAVKGAATFPIFAGTVMAIADEWPEGPVVHQVRFVCADFFSELAAFDGLELAPQGDGDTSGPRIRRILDNAGYTRPVRIDAGAVLLQPTTLAGNALDEIGLTCDTETGAAFIDRDGTFVHRDRNGLATDTDYTNVQAVFGEVPPELCYSELELASDNEKVKNVVSIANAGGVAVTVTDLASIAQYRSRTYRRFDLIHMDAGTSTDIANAHLAAFAFAANRVEKLTCDLVATPSVVLNVLDLGLLNRIRVLRREAGFNVSAELQIQGIEHSITADQWTIAFTTFSAASVSRGARWELDKWDAGKWAY
jgi:hypothetical protein